MNRSTDIPETNSDIIFAACLLLAARNKNDDFLFQADGVEVITDNAMILYQRVKKRLEKIQ